VNGNKQLVESLVFKFIERVGVRLIAFVISVILARLIDPATFGLLAIITVFVSLSQVFVQGGLNIALVQCKEVDEEDYSTVFWISLLVAILFYILLYATAPVIAHFYDSEELVHPLRVLGITLLFGAVNSIQTAQLSREMRFGSQMVCNLIATVIAGCAGIVCAYLEWGIWALVVYNATNQVLVCFLMVFATKWRPKFVFFKWRAVRFVRYGWKILVSNLLYSLYSDLRSLIVGRVFSTEDLAYYDRGNQLPNMVAFNLDQAIQSVMLPTLSKLQDQKEQVRHKLRRMEQVSSYLICPIMVGIAVVAHSFVMLFLSEAWLVCVPYMMVFSIGYCFMPVASYCNVAVKAIGRADVYAKNQAIRIATMFVLLIVSVLVFRSVMAIVICYAISLFLEMIIAIWPTRKLIDYSYFAAMHDVLPNFSIALFAGAVAYCIKFVNVPMIWEFILQIITGIAAYLLMSIITKNKSFRYILGRVRELKLHGSKG
jgi:O-antigen/teichoic acid export membrane protein